MLHEDDAATTNQIKSAVINHNNSNADNGPVATNATGNELVGK